MQVIWLVLHEYVNEFVNIKPKLWNQIIIFHFKSCIHVFFTDWRWMKFWYQLLGEIGQTGVGAKDRKHSKRPHEEDVVD